jgi:hypothetical protein
MPYGQAVAGPALRRDSSDGLSSRPAMNHARHFDTVRDPPAPATVHPITTLSAQETQPGRDANAVVWRDEGHTHQHRAPHMIRPWTRHQHPLSTNTNIASGDNN